MPFLIFFCPCKVLCNALNVCVIARHGLVLRGPKRCVRTILTCMHVLIIVGGEEWGLPNACVLLGGAFSFRSIQRHQAT